MKKAILLAMAACSVGTLFAKEPSPGASSEKRVLARGMTADDVVARVGRPDKVEPVDAPNGVAERWTYWRMLGRTTTQRGVGQGTTLAFTGVKLNDVPVLEYHLFNVTTFQVTSLLIYDGKLVVGKQWKEQTEELTAY